MDLDRVLHEIKLSVMFKTRLDIESRNEPFNMATNGRIAKGVMLILRHLEQNQYANRWSHKHS